MNLDRKIRTFFSKKKLILHSYPNTPTNNKNSFDVQLKVIIKHVIWKSLDIPKMTLGIHFMKSIQTDKNTEMSIATMRIKNLSKYNITLKGEKKKQK